MTFIKAVYCLQQLSKNIRNRQLTDLEIRLVTGLYENLTYGEIATKHNYSSGHLQDVACELFGIVSQKCHEKVTKKNFISAVELLAMKDKSELEKFKSIHGIKPQSIFNDSIEHFNKNNIMIKLTTYWKLNAIRHTLVLRHQNPIVINLEELNLDNLGEFLLNIKKREQITKESFYELVEILGEYFYV